MKNSGGCTNPPVRASVNGRSLQNRVFFRSQGGLVPVGTPLTVVQLWVVQLWLVQLWVICGKYASIEQSTSPILAITCVISRGAPGNTTWEVTKAYGVPRAIPGWVCLSSEAKLSNTTNIFNTKLCLSYSSREWKIVVKSLATFWKIFKKYPHFLYEISP